MRSVGTTVQVQRQQTPPGTSYEYRHTNAYGINNKIIVWPLLKGHCGPFGVRGSTYIFWTGFFRFLAAYMAVFGSIVSPGRDEVSQRAARSRTCPGDSHSSIKTDAENGSRSSAALGRARAPPSWPEEKVLQLTARARLTVPTLRQLLQEVSPRRFGAIRHW